MRAKKRILLVDDEVDIARVVTCRLEKAGYEVLFAKDGKEALALVQDKPDLIILDLLLSGEMDGYEVCRRIKSDYGHKNIAIIFFTADTADLKKISYIVEKFDVQDYVLKPYNWEELLEKIKKYI